MLCALFVAPCFVRKRHPAKHHDGSCLRPLREGGFVAHLPGLIATNGGTKARAPAWRRLVVCATNRHHFIVDGTHEIPDPSVHMMRHFWGETGKAALAWFFGFAFRRGSRLDEKEFRHVGIVGRQVRETKEGKRSHITLQESWGRDVIIFLLGLRWTVRSLARAT